MDFCLKTREPVKLKTSIRVASIVLFVLGILFVVVGIYGYLAGDLNLKSLQPVANRVYEARNLARSLETSITGRVHLDSAGRISVPISLLYAIMNNAAIIILLGVMFLFNATMLRLQSWERMKDLFFVQPAVFFFLVFTYYPIIDLIRISFTDMRMLIPDPQEFVGLKNYEWLFLKSGRGWFIESLLVTLRYTFWEVFVTLVGGILLALLFNRMTKTFNAMRAMVFLPKYIAVTTSAVVFIWILDGNHGILNHILAVFGVRGPNWLNSSSSALTGILFLTVWRVVGYAMMIYLSAMQQIPKEYYDAAAIDGVDAIQRFRYITFPMLGPTTVFLLVTTFISSMKVFQSVDVMTGGGPGNATNVLVQWVYNLSFSQFRAARAASVSVVFFFILLICTAITMRWSDRAVSYES